MPCFAMFRIRRKAQAKECLGLVTPCGLFSPAVLQLSPMGTGGRVPNFQNKPDEKCRLWGRSSWWCALVSCRWSLQLPGLSKTDHIASISIYLYIYISLSLSIYLYIYELSIMVNLDLSTNVPVESWDGTAFSRMTKIPCPTSEHPINGPERWTSHTKPLFSWLVFNIVNIEGKGFCWIPLPICHAISAMSSRARMYSPLSAMQKDPGRLGSAKLLKAAMEGGSG